MTYTLSTLSDAVRAKLLESHVLANTKAYRDALSTSKVVAGGGLFSMGLDLSAPAETQAEARTIPLIWATSGYADEIAHEFADPIPNDVEKLAVIVPRSQKAKAIQKLRTKEKAEVFTPSWVCNMQNNLIDDAILYEGAFNSQDPDDRTKWIPNPDKVRFEGEQGWLKFVVDRRLEMACGEAPYLVSPYDTVDGAPIPVRDESGLWRRIGIVDRKLRVVSENVDDVATWKTVAFAVFKATYGNEYQGDNLLLARLNMLNTYRDYLLDVWNMEPTEGELLELAEIVSWNLFQSDGLKQVTPESCSVKCKACEAKERKGHDGLVNVIRWGSELRSFESLLEQKKEFAMPSAMLIDNNMPPRVMPAFPPESSADDR